MVTAIPDDMAAAHQALRRDGFTTISAFCPLAEVVDIRAILCGLMARRAGLAEGWLFDFAAPSFDPANPRLLQMLWPSKQAPQLAQTRFYAKSLALARRLLGPDAEFLFDHAICKPPFDGAETPWHQDIAFHQKHDRHQNLTFWMPLQDVNAHNGCLYFQPRSHRSRLFRHRPIGGDARIHGLEAQGIPQAGRVLAPLPAGGVSIHDSRTLHGAGANHAAAPRWSYALVFRRPGRDRLYGHHLGPWLRDPLAALIPPAPTAPQYPGLHEELA